MILIGDETIPFEDTAVICTADDIKNSKPQSTLIFNYNIELIKYCHNNALDFAVIVDNIKELIYSSQFDTKYIICEKELSIKAQKIAENYMFDAKILSTISDSDEIVWIAQNEIDGAVYKRVLS